MEVNFLTTKLQIQNLYIDAYLHLAFWGICYTTNIFVLSQDLICLFKQWNMSYQQYGISSQPVSLVFHHSRHFQYFSWGKKETKLTHDLGLILDKGLTWKQHVQHIVTKALMVFWACKGLHLVNQWWHIECTSLW